MLQERYPQSLARAVIDWIQAERAVDLESAGADRELAARAVEIADAAEALLAGVTFSAHFAVSAVADGPGFRRALHAAGVAVETLSFGDRLQADAAFASLSSRRGKLDAAAAHALMVDVLSAAVTQQSDPSRRRSRR